MTDVDASLLYFCNLVSKKNKVALTGECADEIFGGYPWFYRKELLEKEGHTIIQKGRKNIRYYVKDYEKVLFIPDETI